MGDIMKEIKDREEREKFQEERERVKHLPLSERSTDPNHPNFDPSMDLKIEPWMKDLINPKKPPLWKVWGLKAAKGALIVLQVVGIISLVILVAFLVGVGLGGLMAIVDILVGAGT